MKFIDLHVHSNCSDGTIPPRELVRLAAQSGLSAFALTDHDNTAGVAEALSAADEYGVEVIPGVEFSTEYLGMDIHIVGLEFELENPKFQKKVSEYRDERLFRNRRMIDRMAGDGIDITWEAMEKSFGPIAWTRAHFGRYLLDHGYVKDISEAFSQYIGEDCKYFIPREKSTPYDAVRLLRRYGGIPILAHPFQYRLSREQLEELIGGLKDVGLIGMEVYYSTYSEEQSEDLLALARKYDLAPSGGSDFHGTNKPSISLGTGIGGNLSIPYSVLDGLRAKRKETAGHASKQE